ncbi:unnamed protein product [Clonostachys rhizophaga]|uniref:Uncharacterized protein n=1 Tax=Clonostachys rhizophaga TaxID=160324 RepID=A0A9N9V5B2_9HYPO|nr:unnamed protein product [Clonostachys rhizophaga]
MVKGSVQLAKLSAVDPNTSDRRDIKQRLFGIKAKDYYSIMLVRSKYPSCLIPPPLGTVVDQDSDSIPELIQKKTSTRIVKWDISQDNN